MKITKNMYYREDENSHELFLFTVTDALMYCQCITPVIKNLHKKFLKGTYDAEKAIVAFYHVATNAAKKYNQTFPSSEYIFSVTVRWTVAKLLIDLYEEDIFEEE